MPIFPQEQITIRRYPAQIIGSDFRPLAGTPTETDAWARVQPPTDDMELVPEGYRTKERRRFNTLAEVRVADEASGVRADEIVWNGRTWRVFRVDGWRGLGYIARHYVCEAVALQVLAPPAGTP